MAECIRCEQSVPLGSQATCQRNPCGGAHEFLPHPFRPGRLDGLCAYPDSDFGTSCGHPKDSEMSPIGGVFHEVEAVHSAQDDTR